MKKYLFLIGAAILFYFAMLMAEFSPLPSLQLMKYALVLLGMFFVAVFVSEMKMKTFSLPRLEDFTTYDVSYEWNYSKPIAILTPLGKEGGAVIEYPSHTPPSGFQKVSLPFSRKALWVPVI